MPCIYLEDKKVKNKGISALISLALKPCDVKSRKSWGNNKIRNNVHLTLVNIPLKSRFDLSMLVLCIQEDILACNSYMKASYSVKSHLRLINWLIIQDCLFYLGAKSPGHTLVLPLCYRYTVFPFQHILQGPYNYIFSTS